ncbi:MAG: hypothetical protein MPW14_03175 [Candidatus Manganitrophus sp.]|nr:MAG: hypothetical protein MPW14_03175 [Candidatus Manganitrophus sp.]
MARHSSIARFGLATCPSKVQLVRSIALTRSSLPSAIQSQQRLLDRFAAGRLPYIEYCGSG